MNDSSKLTTHQINQQSNDLKHRQPKLKCSCFVKAPVWDSTRITL